MNIDSAQLLLTTGALLLGLAALTGFVQARTERGSEAESRWRVVHSGGTAGGVQLIALAAVWQDLSGTSPVIGWVGACLVLSTWLFFVGPLLKALQRIRSARLIVGLGGLVAIPAYLGLIVLSVSRYGSSSL